MQAEPNKFQFMVIYVEPVERQNVELQCDFSIVSEYSVKDLDAVTEDWLNCDELICTRCA